MQHDDPIRDGRDAEAGTSGDSGPPDDDIAAYVAAYLEVERPSAARKANTWNALATATSEESRGPWLAVAALAAAACLLVAWVNRDVFSPQVERLPPTQAPYDAAPGETHALTSESRASGRTAPKATAMTAEPSQDSDAGGSETEGSGPEAAPGTDRSRPRKSGKARVAPTIAEASTLGRETERLKAIQEALVARRYSEALAGAASYAREFPRGAFRHEVTIARARAECGLGRVGDARATAKVFVSRHPNSHLVARALEICAD